METLLGKVCQRAQPNSGTPDLDRSTAYASQWLSSLSAAKQKASVGQLSSSGWCPLLLKAPFLQATKAVSARQHSKKDKASPAPAVHDTAPAAAYSDSEEGEAEPPPFRSGTATERVHLPPSQVITSLW